MKVESHKISIGEFLAKIEPFKTSGLPTDSITYKEIPGCGATTLELLFERNSIIIEPNIPVIIGKCKKMNKGKRKNKVVIGVWADTTVEDINRYIKNRKGYKKILTTPEGFEKVLEAIGDSIYTDYFLLFDECEKAIQDIDYRKTIINPMDEFFDFDNKAFISATPIMPSDPGFKDFKQVHIEPDYDFKDEIHVLITNNIIYQLKKVFDHYENTDRKFFIFYKSTSRICDIIRSLKIEDYTVYCAEKSGKELKINDTDKVFSNINDKFSKVNFLTSRFFSAVDIDFELYACDPIIIMISDVMAIEHSRIDPRTESIQICGRFRKPEDDSFIINKDIFHISNYNSKLTSYSEHEVFDILKDKERLHRFITRFKPNSDIEYFNIFIQDILDLNGFSYFLRNESSELNYFMVDNFINKERVKGYYQSTTSLIEEYKLSHHFAVSEISGYYKYILTDQQLMEITPASKQITVNEFVSAKVKEIIETIEDPIYQQFNLAMLRMIYPNQMRVIDDYGLQNAKQFDYDINKIQQHIKEAKGLSKLLPIIKFIQREFKKQKYTSDEITNLLERGIAETGLSNLKPNIPLLRNAAKLSDRINVKKDENGNWIKGYEILYFLQKF